MCVCVFFFVRRLAARGEKKEKRRSKQEEKKEEEEDPDGFYPCFKLFSSHLPAERSSSACVCVCVSVVELKSGVEGGTYTKAS